jgi:Heat shock factor binding protein 1
MGHSILGKMDDMGSRIDELEHSIASLLLQAGLDGRMTKSSSPNEVPMRVSQQKKKNPSRSSPVQQASSPIAVASPTTIESPSAMLSPGTRVSSRPRVTIEI